MRVCSRTSEKEEAACHWEQERVAAEVRGTLRTDFQHREGRRREAQGGQSGHRQYTTEGQADKTRGAIGFQHQRGRGAGWEAQGR